MDIAKYKRDLDRITEMSINQVLQAEEKYWNSTAASLSEELLTLEQCLSLDEEPEDAPSASESIYKGPTWPWPEIVKVPICNMDINGNHSGFEFCWPQKGDVDPSIFTQNVRVSQIKILCNYDIRGV